MSEPESRLPTPRRIPSGTVSVGTLPPLTLPPPRLDPLAGISSVHHSYASPSLTSQMMSSPILQSGVMSPVSSHSPASHQIISPQQKSQPASLAVQVSQPHGLQELRRPNMTLLHQQEQIRGQFSHIVTTVPSSKRPSEMGRQIQSVPNSPASLAISTPPQSVQPRHGSLDAQPSPGSGSIDNPSPSYSNHSSPSLVQLHNGHGPPSSYTQSSTLHTHSVQPVARFSSIPTQEHLQHHVSIGSLSSTSGKQVFQHDVQSRPLSGSVPTTGVQQRCLPVASQLPQPHASQPQSLLQQQLCARSSRVLSQTAAIPGAQANVVIQQQPLPQIAIGQSQQNGQQCTLKPRSSQEVISRHQSASGVQQHQQHVVMGLLQGAQIQQQQVESGAGYGNSNVSNPHVRQILACRTPQGLSGPPGPSSQQGAPTHPAVSSPPRMSPSALQQQVVVPHGILPSQANLPLRSVLAAQHQLNQQQLLQQRHQQQQHQQQQQQIAVQQSQPQQQLRVSTRAGGTASGALATLYDTERAATTLTNKDAYRILKRRFKYLVYENECYQEELRNLQRKLLKLSRDKNFLLDRLGQFEKFDESSDEDSDASNKTSDEKPKPKKRARPAQRKRTADDGLEGTSVAKRSAEEGNVSSPSPSGSPNLDRPGPLSSTAPMPSTYKHSTNPALTSDRMGGSEPLVASGSSYGVPQQGVSGVLPHQQILRTTLARVVPSNVLGQQSQPVVQQGVAQNRSVVDSRAIVAKVRVESSPNLPVSAGTYHGEQIKQTTQKKMPPRDSRVIQPQSADFAETQQDVQPNNPMNGDNVAVSTILAPPVSMAPPPLEPCRSVQSVSSYSLLNGMLPDGANIADTKEEGSSASVMLAPPTSQHR
ncbi:hypothetical protein Q1695_015169 [Nippostrongylus brasiliensis]|nr:hypothetical protein Q1695_015169 [Nippostrongylus brasiliensis]